MDVDERCEDTDQHAASGEHDDNPEIKLLIRPVIALSHDDALVRDAAPHAGGVRASQLEYLMGFGRPTRSTVSQRRNEPGEEDRSEN